MLAAFGLLGLVLAAVGLYGTVAYLVDLPKREIAIRMALGARRGGVFSLVIAEALRLTALGIAIGLALSFPMGRLLAGLVAGIYPGHALTYAATTAIVWIAVALAGDTFRRAGQRTQSGEYASRGVITAVDSQTVSPLRTRFGGADGGQEYGQQTDGRQKRTDAIDEVDAGEIGSPRPGEPRRSRPCRTPVQRIIPKSASTSPGTRS